MEEQVYIFKVYMAESDDKIYRTMELKGTTTLFHFAETIVTSFGFRFDHCFGFYENIDDIDESNEVYTLFYDNGNPTDPIEMSVKKSHIYEVFRPNKEMVFLFDYGEDWMFLVKCLAVADIEADKTYPIITEKEGEAPEQYPDLDDDDRT